jgi:hypothetical protein
MTEKINIFSSRKASANHKKALLRAALAIASIALAFPKIPSNGKKVP